MNVFKRMQAQRLARRLVEAGKATDASVAETQEQLLALGPKAATALFDSLAGNRAQGPALDALTKLLTDDSLPAYIAALKSPELAVLETATLVLSTAKTYDPKLLLALYSDAEVPKARLEGILAEQKDLLAPQALLELMPELSREARTSVLRLVESRSDPSLAAAAARLSHHTDWWVRQSMARLLAKCPGPESVDTLVTLLRDEVPAVRLAAVHGLGSLKPPQAVAPLCGRLRDPDMKVQGAAIEALIQIGDVRAVASLLECLKDDAEYVRRAAVEVLNQVVTVDAVKDLASALRDQDWWVRVRSADALGTLGGPRVVETAVALVDDPDEFVRRYAVEILIMVPDGRSVEPLVRALDDSDWWVRERAIDALAKVGDGRAVDPLLGLIARDARVIPLCVRALANIGDERAVEPICRLAASEAPDVRAEALAALGALAKRDLSKDARAAIASTLESLGVVPGRARPARVEARGSLASEPVRRNPDTGRDSSASAAGPRTPATPVPTPDSGARRDLASPATSATPASSSPTPSAAPPPNYQRLDPGVVLGDRWRVVRRIGGGGFGTVYLVQDLVVNEDMVLKILSPHLSLDPSMIKRFVQELRLTRRITHRNVIRIHDLVDLDGAHAISMEYFEGRDLGQLVRDSGALPVPRALDLIDQTLQGLACAHDLGIYHRDIKPANILVGADDTVKIVDFGLASVGHSTKSRLTQSGILIGTPEYISPEQIVGTQVDGRSDLYSLGCVLYYMLSATEPFTGDTAVNILFQHLEGRAPALSGVAQVPEALGDYVMRVLSKDPAQRPATALEMMGDLERLREAA